MLTSEKSAVRTYEYRIRPNKKFVEACEREMEHSREIYNAALEEPSLAIK